MAVTCQTNVELLGRLATPQDDPAAWEEFVGVYAQPLFRWCRSYGLQPVDAADVAQDVLVRFWRQSKRYRRDPSCRFRTFLRRIVVGAVSDWYRAKKKLARPGDEWWKSVETRAEAAVAPEPSPDRDVVDRVVAEVRRRVKPHTWRAFELQVLDGKTGGETARELGVAANVAYVARHKVTRMLRETARGISSGTER